MKMTAEIRKVFALVDEMEEEKKKTKRVPHYYKRNGQMLRRSYDDTIETDRYRELFYSAEGGIRDNKCFTCEECGDKVDFFSVGWWACADGHCVCSCCVEEAYGDDL